MTAAGAFLCAVLGHVALNVTFSLKDEERTLLRGVANVTPDGEVGRFTSNLGLPGDRRGGGRAPAYEYDARAGTLTRISSGRDAYDGEVDDFWVGEGAREVEVAFASQGFYGYREGHACMFSSVIAEAGLERTSLFGGEVSGSNVFFSTPVPFVFEDRDTRLDYYDARICGEGEEADAAHEECPASVAHASPYREDSAGSAKQSTAKTIKSNRRAK